MNDNSFMLKFFHGRKITFPLLDRAFSWDSFSVSGDPDYYYPRYAERKWHQNWERIDETGISLTRWSQQIESEHKVNFFFRYQKRKNTYSCMEFETQMTLYKYSKNFIENLIPDGFRAYDIWGYYDHSPYTDTSNRMIFSIGRNK